MKGRFWTWCLLIYIWLVVLGGLLWLLDQFGLSGWERFVALVPALLFLRFTVQRFLSKNRDRQSE